MRLGLIILVTLATTGCANAPSKGHYESETSIHSAKHEYLDEHHQARAEDFLRRHADYTERNKINYLLDVVKNSELTFIRNGMEYDSAAASRWLLWKSAHRQYREDPITTAEDFVNRVTMGSNATGIPYEIVFPDGTHERVWRLLAHELSALESVLKATAVAKASSSANAAQDNRRSISLSAALPAAVMAVE
ncbi:MAG: DUF5329 family protein [Candidatus Omnitrophota bacterium]|nr:DUF5329 family protein [Candidatus Omnitrophota bacterium]